MLKKFTFSFLLVLSFVAINAQFRKVPGEVTDSFKARYGNAAHVAWRDKFTSFQAEYKIGDNEMKSSFSSKGEWLKTETKLSFTTLPAHVKDGFKKSKYAEMLVTEMLKVEEKEKATEYRMTVKGGDFNKKSLVFSITGQLISDKGIF